MTPEVKERLLASMYAERLVVVCGAGLSMAPPSNLPSARTVAAESFDQYRLTIKPDCDPTLRGDLEALTKYFADLDILKTVFIDKIVPWKDFVLSQPNVGHAAVADFLIVRAAVAGLSGNYDSLIERSAQDYGFDFQGALDGDEAVLHARTQGPLLKLHGCCQRDRSSTIWSSSQLQDQVIAARIQKSKTWMAANLRQKDLLIVGFWSDWQYLNEIIGAALDDLNPRSVTVADPSDAGQLQQKAPDLWTLAHAENVAFHHVQESGTNVLDELRRSFSQNYIRQMLAAGREAFEQEVGIRCDSAWLDVADFDSETLYGWRRDAEGVPNGQPATKQRPENAKVLGFFHLLLRQAGAQQNEDTYEMNGRTIRVINGAAEFLGTLRSRFIEAPAIPTADIVVAVGATTPDLPGNIVHRGRPGDFIRPEAGGRWFDMYGGRKELNL